MAEKNIRMEKVRNEVKAARYDELLAEKNSKAKSLEVTREELNSEFKSLSSQSDSRARLGLKRDDVKLKTGEIKHT